MKKFIVLSSIFFIISALLQSCDLFAVNDIIAINNSTYDVLFTLNKTSVQLKTGERYTYVHSDNIRRNNYPTGITPNSRVTYRHIDDDTFEFIDIERIIIKVSNNFSFPVTMTADGYLDREPMVDIVPGYSDDENHHNFIYTNKPKLSVKAGSFPGKAEYNIVDDIMYITIH